ncbi:MAG: hypothetical protein WBA74_15965, partial [Cyclobacteriaceae bacterium]
ATLENTSISALTITFAGDYHEKSQLEKLFLKEKRLHQIQVYQSTGETTHVGHKGKIVYSDRQANKYYPKYRYEDFAISIPFFTESLQHHTYLNRKLFVAPDGEISNTPDFTKTFGKIGTADIRKLIDDSEFTMYFDIRKENLPVCRQCEFRHICLDRRIPEKDDNGNWRLPNECGYNPYQMLWLSENGYQTPSDTGAF